MGAEVVTRFRLLESTLFDRFPEASKEADTLAEAIADPSTADPDAIWARVWDKPLFAYTKVRAGSNMIARLSPHMSGAWRRWGAQGHDFLITKIGKGNRTTAFHAATPLAVEVRQTTKIAMHRLFAIQGAATALRIRTTRNRAPYADLTGLDPSIVLATIRREMGPGWGHITVLHFLTDLGLACKPDRHLVRTLRHLGMTPDLRVQEVPSPVDAIIINRRVRSLLEQLDGSIRPSRLRYLDKVLMDISARGLLKS